MSQSEAERLGLLLRTKNKDTRGAAARALGALGEPALPVLLTATQDPDWKVRYRAVEALGHIPGVNIDTHLIHILDDSRDHVRYMAAKMLGYRKVSRAATSLEHLLGDENEYVRKRAAIALKEIALPSSIPALKAALSRETCEDIRKALYTALSALHPSDHSA